MLLGSIPMQTITDLAAFAELVKELKSGKGADLLIEIKNKSDALREEEGLQVARLEAAEKSKEETQALLREIQAKETKVTSDLEALTVKQKEIENTLARAKEVERAAEGRRRDIDERVARVNRELEDRSRAVEQREHKLAVQAQDLEARISDCNLREQKVRDALKLIE